MQQRELSEFSLRGRTFEGVVLDINMTGTCRVQFTRLVRHRILGRSIRNNYILLAYIPRDFSSLTPGDRVRVGETRKLSKRSSYVVYQVLNPAVSR